MFPLALLTLALADAGPLPDADLAARAEDAFAEGVRLREDSAEARAHFRAAAADLEELRRHGAHNPRLYRTLGNAHLLGGDLPQAIRAYRRGLRLAPGDPGLRADLDAARGQVGYGGPTLGQPPRDDRPPWLPPLSPAWFFWPAVACHALFWLLVLRWRIRRGVGRLVLAGLALLLTLAGATATGLLLWQEARERGTVFVVIAEDGVLLRRGDALTFPPRYETPVNRGVEGRLLYTKGGWLQIALEDGAVGWIPAEYALIE